MQNEAITTTYFLASAMSQHRFDIKPTYRFCERLIFGNRVAYFVLQQPTPADVTAISEVTIFPRQNNLDLLNQMTWEQVRSCYKNRLARAIANQLGQLPNRIRLLKYWMPGNTFLTRQW
jgi:hypothetical protein